MSVWIDDLRTSPGDEPLPPTAVAELKPVKGDPDNWWTKWWWRSLIGLAVLIAVGFAVWGIVAWLGNVNTGETKQVEGLTIFAVFFVTALAIERVLEPLALIEPQKEALKDEKANADKEAVKSIKADAGDKQQKLKDFADAKVKVDVWTSYRALILWAAASIVGAFAAELLNLQLLKGTGLATPGAYLETLATALIIGAGTKPLHDLTKLLVATKTAATS